MALAFLVIGFVMFATGLALWSKVWALVICGLMLFVSGGLELRRESQHTRAPQARRG